MNRVATVLTMLVALALALLVALGLGVTAYALSLPELAESFHSRAASGTKGVPTEFVFFSILSLCFLLWASLPLSLGSSRQFDPGNLLLYPISLRKLFAIDIVSEVASLQSVFAIPAIIAMGIGVGLARGNLAGGVLIALLAALFGMALSKWISISIGSLLRRKRARGETLLALIGVIAGLGGAVFGQLVPVLLRHAESISALRWTPPGAIAYALTHGLDDGNLLGYAAAVVGVGAYAALLIGISYWLSRRDVLGSGRRKRVRPASTVLADPKYVGWELPLVSPALSGVVEKELRYVLRNAQVRMMMLMPLILIVVRIMNRKWFDDVGASGSTVSSFSSYGQGLMATGGMLYVFLILAGLFCNQFAFERGGMRAFILSPLDRKIILMGKNIAVSTVALVFSSGLLLVNELVFRDLTPGALLFVVLSFFIFTPLMSVMGNWLSIRFPKRMKFGKGLNVSGVAGLLLIPMIIVLALPPLAATAVGYVAQSLLIQYATLAVLAALAIGAYLLTIDSQADLLQRRELEILEVINDPGSETG